MFDDAELDFEAVLPENLQKRFFYFVSPDGIQELRAERLKGIVRFSLGTDGTIVSRTVYGYVVAKAVDHKNLAPAGFVLAFHQPRTFEIRESTHDTKKLVPQEVRENWETLSAADRQFWTVEKKYVFRFQGEDRNWTFVQWVPDKACYEVCCELRYSVLVGEETPRTIAGYSGSCDI